MGIVEGVVIIRDSVMWGWVNDRGKGKNGSVCRMGKVLIGEDRVVCEEVGISRGEW